MEQREIDLFNNWRARLNGPAQSNSSIPSISSLRMERLIENWLNLKGCGPLGGLSIHLWIEWSQGGRASHFLFLNEIKKEMKWAQQARAAFLFHFIPTIQSIKQTFLFELNDCWWNEESSPPAAAQRAANKTFSFMNERRKLLFCSSRALPPFLHKEIQEFL